MPEKNAAARQITIQRQIRGADKKHPKKNPGEAMQAGAQEYPAPPFPRQHQSKPGSEAALNPAPMYEAPFYIGSRKLDKKVTLITGGDSGIGRAVAILFAREGGDIAIGHLNEKRHARTTQQGVEAEGRRCLVIAGDVSDQKFCEKADQQAVNEFGRLDILVNNAAFQVHALRFEDLIARSTL